MLVVGKCKISRKMYRKQEPATTRHVEDDFRWKFHGDKHLKNTITSFM